SLLEAAHPAIRSAPRPAVFLLRLGHGGRASGARAGRATDSSDGASRRRGSRSPDQGTTARGRDYSQPRPGWQGPARRGQADPVGGHRGTRSGSSRQVGAPPSGLAPQSPEAISLEQRSGSSPAVGRVPKGLASVRPFAPGAQASPSDEH